MHALVNTGPGEIRWQELLLPEPGAGQVRIRTGFCGICATDLQMINGWSRTAFPAIPGHEWAGTVDKAGPGVDQRMVGNRCVGENVLADGGEVGFEHPGGYAEYFITEAERLYMLPDSTALAQAALIEPLAVCVRGLTRLGVEGAEAALVFGDGPIGLIVVMLLETGGVSGIILVGGRQQRLKLARESGATETYNYHECGDELAKRIRTANGGGGYPIVIECSGSGRALKAGMQCAAHDGRILVLGDYGTSRAEFTWNELLLKEISIIGSNASAGAWPKAVEIAGAVGITLDRIITHRLPAERGMEGIEIARNDPGAIKVILEW